MRLPEAFLSSMKEKLGEKFPDFLRSYDTPAQRGLRVNTLKISKEDFFKIAPCDLTPVPWEETGFYVTQEKLGAHPYHFAGLYYMQEPSAMSAVPLLDVKAGDRVLDLCASPGGKSTRIAQALNGSGVLVSNEYVYSRAKILSQNIERLGIKNCLVTSGDTKRFTVDTLGYFDKVLVDAPCSGEGMFKKEENAVAEWSEENIARCALRQAEILHNASLAVRGGGVIVYSTCTFSEQENEGQIANFLKTHPNFELETMHTLYPHEVRGEGHFTAKLRRIDDFVGQVKQLPIKKDVVAERAYRAFADGFFARDMGFCPSYLDSRMCAVTEESPLVKLPTLRHYLELGSVDKGIFKPAHALAMALKKQDVQRFVSLSQAEAEKFLHGDTVESDLSNGWCLVGVEDYPIGIGKIVNGTVKNHIPKGIRKVK